jgi:hypothetical protein
MTSHIKCLIKYDASYLLFLFVNLRYLHLRCNYTLPTRWLLSPSADQAPRTVPERGFSDQLSPCYAPSAHLRKCAPGRVIRRGRPDQANLSRSPGPWAASERAEGASPG